jgi:enterochelin esterase family protein
MTNVPGTRYWYRLATLRLGTTHNYNYFAEGKSLGTYEVAGYNPDSYAQPGVPRGTISAMKTLKSSIYPGMESNSWVYVNPGADLSNGAPLMVWQDGETIVGNQDLLRLRLQIVSDNLVAKKLIPPMVHVLIQPGSGNMRSVEYDTVSDRYGKYLMQEILPDVEKTYKIRHDAYSRAIAGASSGAICAFNVAWFTRISTAACSPTSAATWPCNGIPSRTWTAATSFRTKFGATRRRTCASGSPTGPKIRKPPPAAGR